MPPAFVVVLLFAAVATADSVMDPYSYTRPSPDGQYLFVMIAPGTIDQDAGRFIEPRATEIRQIRERYTVSGMYRNDGSTPPLWTVDWFEFGVEPLSDGIHIVVPGPWASSTEDAACTFYANGQLVQRYEVGDLVALPWLMQHTASHFFWRDDTSLDDAAKTYSITTKHGERYTFDIVTGRIIRSFSPITWALRIMVAVLVTVVGIYVYRWKRRRALPVPARGRP